MIKLIIFCFFYLSAPNECILTQKKDVKKTFLKNLHVQNLDELNKYTNLAKFYDLDETYNKLKKILEDLNDNNYSEDFFSLNYQEYLKFNITCADIRDSIVVIKFIHQRYFREYLKSCLNEIKNDNNDIYNELIKNFDKIDDYEKVLKINKILPSKNFNFQLPIEKHQQKEQCELTELTERNSLYEEERREINNFYEQEKKELKKVIEFSTFLSMFYYEGEGNILIKFFQKLIDSNEMLKNLIKENYNKEVLDLSFINKNFEKIKYIIMANKSKIIEQEGDENKKKILEEIFVDNYMVLKEERFYDEDSKKELIEILLSYLNI